MAKGRINHDAIKKAQDTGSTQPVRKTIPEIGRISVGAKGVTASGKEYPTSTDYFVIRSKFDTMVHAKYGAQPTELPIFFYSDDFSEVCREQLELRDGAGKLWATGDGETFQVWSIKLGAYMSVTTKEQPDVMEKMIDLLRKDLSQDKARLIDWQQSLTVRFIIKDIPVLGYWQFTTKAVKTTIPNLRDRFDECLEMFKTVRFFPFTLTVKKVKSNNPGQSKSYPIVDIVPAISLETGLALAEHLQAHPEINQAKLALIDWNAKGGSDAVKLLGE